MDRNNDNKPLQATEFTPLDATGNRRRLPLSPTYLTLGVLATLAALVLLFLFTARAVIFRSDPVNAEISISGLSFHIGNNFLMLRGDHLVRAEAEGYFPAEQQITVSDAATQEIELVLNPLPGSLELISELDDIQVSIDDQPAGTAPGIIEEISKGPHKITFEKHRYFQKHQEIEIEGLGRKQSLTVSLEPAWGQMQFSSVPEGAELYIDDQLIGNTPLTTEVLETGSMLKLTAKGYKTWQKEVTVAAGTQEVYPPIKLTVADGTLVINSTPRSAGVTINNEFKGAAPLTVSLSPFGSHKVELFLEGYKKAVRNVSIESEHEATLNVKLVPIIGQIQLTIHPDDAGVVVDGNDVSRGSQVLSLTAKEHLIEIEKTGYQSQAFKVTPRPGHKQSLDIKLLTVQQAYWASRPPLITSPVGSQLKLFRPNASFTMGAPRREPGRRANEVQRKVRLERPFYIGTHEVSNAEFRFWKEEHSSTAIKGQTLDMEDQPAVKVTWQDAALYCNWLSRRAGLPLFYIEENGLVTGVNRDSSGYRLPTEAEWAWVAKINEEGQSLIFPWDGGLYPPTQPYGNYADQSAAVLLSFTLSGYNDGFVVSAPVGSFEPSARGLYDLSGNVAEWCNDYYEIRPGADEPVLDPIGPETGNRHVIRGASWSLGSRSELRLSYRDAGTDGRLDLGFRIARYVDKAGIEQ